MSFRKPITTLLHPYRIIRGSSTCAFLKAQWGTDLGAFGGRNLEGEVIT